MRLHHIDWPRRLSDFPGFRLIDQSGRMATVH